MGTKRIVPCIWMDDQAEEAAAFYAATFPNSRTLGMSRYPKSGTNPSGKPPGSVLVAEIEVAGHPFTLLNGGPQFRPKPSISFFVYAGSAREVDRLHAALVEGGMALMPLDRYPWSERYAWVQDRFGVSWQLMADPPPEGQVVVPCLMFANALGGRAHEAMETYVKILGGEVESVARYEEGQAPKDWISHGRFRLGDQRFAAMDAPGEHAFGFDEGISLQVACDDQATIDRLWASLSEGGEPGVCGWLTDRYGVRWQLVASQMGRWMIEADEATRDRLFAALMQMKKIDLGALERAYRGG